MKKLSYLIGGKRTGSSRYEDANISWDDLKEGDIVYFYKFNNNFKFIAKEIRKVTRINRFSTTNFTTVYNGEDEKELTDCFIDEHPTNSTYRGDNKFVCYRWAFRGNGGYGAYSREDLPYILIAKYIKEYF